MSDMSFCEQRRLIQLFNVPLARYTPPNPYLSGKFTKFQLDMRRKTEILKYSPNKSSSQTNNLTRNQKFALLAKGGLPSISQSRLQTLQTDCSNDQMMPTPTSSSNVPGPVTFLYEDPTVPLYNYSEFNTQSYPDFVPNDLEPWQFIQFKDVIVYTNGSGGRDIYYLIIGNRIDKPLYTYNIITPIGISIAGNIPSTYTPNGFTGDIEFKITSLSLAIYYGSNLVKRIQPANLSTDDKMNIKVNTANVGGSFNAVQYIGNIRFNNIELYTTPTYVYKFVLSMNITVEPNNTGLVRYAAILANMTTTNSIANGCTILSSASNDINSGASITGI